MSTARILILGLGKSGTTGLFYCLRDSAETHYATPFSTVFEPKVAADLAAFDTDYSIAKILLERQQSFGEHPILRRATHKVFIVRDPRDNVISRLIYLIARRIADAPPAVRAATIDALRRKQQDPASVGVAELYARAGPVTHATADAARDAAYSPLAFLATQAGEYFLLAYEDFIDGRTEALAGYLGFAVKQTFRQSGFKSVKRVARHGYWRSWFTDADTDFFVTGREDALRRLGYEPGAPLDAKRIDHSEALGYVARLNPGLLPEL